MGKAVQHNQGAADQPLVLLVLLAEQRVSDREPGCSGSAGSLSSALPSLGTGRATRCLQADLLWLQSTAGTNGSICSNSTFLQQVPTENNTTPSLLVRGCSRRPLQ